LDKLLASHQNLDHLFQGKITAAAAASMAPYQQQQLMEQLGLEGSNTSSMQRIPLQYLGCQATDLLRFSK
jgi:predicted naringenin-chalcone synthase